jgi:hypothetical protein
MKLKNLFQSDKDKSYPTTPINEEETCCGEHEVCEHGLPKRPIGLNVEYYDDEELDIYKNRPADSYSEQEIAEFAEVFHTMLESDVPGWLMSLQHRGIELPNLLKDEAMLFL